MGQVTYMTGHATRGHSHVDAESIRGELEKILRSATFNSAKRLQAFLSYTVSQALASVATC
jgi:hypothetical protein